MVRTMVAAAAMTTLGTLPVFLLSAQAVLIREDLRFTETQLGLAVSVFFGAAALASLSAGQLAERLGRRWSTVLAGGLAAVGTLGIAVAATSYPVLLGWLVVAGLANAALQMTSNVTLARSVPPDHRGLAFGVKQSAIPVATMIGGIAVPAVGVALGWELAYAAAAVAAAFVVLMGLRVQRGDAQPRASHAVRESAPTGALLTIAVVMTLASAAVNSLGAFLPVWAFRVGLDPGTAGWLLAAVSAGCIVARIGLGLAADRRDGRNLPVVASLMAVGAVGLVLLAGTSTTSLLLGAFLAFTVGWSWPGLMLFAVVRVGRDSPAHASGAVQAGAFLGGASGPLLFGLLVTATSYPTAWRAAATALLLAAALSLLARRQFIADIVRRPPQGPVPAPPPAAR